MGEHTTPNNSECRSISSSFPSSIISSYFPIKDNNPHRNIFSPLNIQNFTKKQLIKQKRKNILNNRINISNSTITSNTTASNQKRKKHGKNNYNKEELNNKKTALLKLNFVSKFSAKNNLFIHSPTKNRIFNNNDDDDDNNIIIPNRINFNNSSSFSSSNLNISLLFPTMSVVNRNNWIFPTSIDSVFLFFIFFEFYFLFIFLFYNVIDGNKKTVRQYQCDITSACILANTLVCLPTGLGKVI
jgi:hypothetical protein